MRVGMIDFSLIETHYNPRPAMGFRDLDLFRLYTVVSKLGGSAQVRLTSRHWHAVYFSLVFRSGEATDARLVFNNYGQLNERKEWHLVHGDMYFSERVTPNAVKSAFDKYGRNALLAPSQPWVDSLITCPCLVVFNRHLLAFETVQLANPPYDYGLIMKSRDSVTTMFTTALDL